MKELGMRLRAERKRLGLSQQVLGAMGGVAANAQGKYESGERLPKADYLVALAKGGVDVLYVLTDRRDHAVRNPDTVVTAQDTLLKEVEMAVRAFTASMATAGR
jgi:transcriptional regulator with XRE-family HTH domain